MRSFLPVVLVGFVVQVLSGCSSSVDSPERVFEIVTLKATVLPRTFENQFRQIRDRKGGETLEAFDPETSQMKPVTVSEFVDIYYTNEFEDDVVRVKELKVTKDAEPLKEAALALYIFADELYKVEYPRLATMIDDEIPDEEFDHAVKEIDESKLKELLELYEAFVQEATSYAEKHQIEFQFTEI